MNDEQIIVANSQGNKPLGIYAFDTEGNNLWSTEIKDPESSSTGSTVFEAEPVILNDRFIIGDTQGNLYAFSLADGTRQWHQKLPLTESPRLAGTSGTLYVAQNWISAIDPKTGEKIWSRRSPDFRTIRAPAISNQDVYFPCVADPSANQPGLVAIDGDSGQTIWTQSFDHGGIQTSPAIVKDHIITGCSNGHVHAYGFGGTERWTYKTDGGITSAPVADEDTVYVGTSQGKIHAIALETGENKWRYSTYGPIQGSMALVQDALVIPCEDSNLYALEAKQ